MPKTAYGMSADTWLSGLADAKARKLQEINAACDLALGELTARYPAAEVLTFDQQKTEAEAYSKDQTADCPLLAPLAQARGIALDEQCRRVLARSATFSAASGAIIGQRQGMKDTLAQCTSIEEVQAIAVQFNLPAA